jgi:flagellar biosynthetic protein FliQ
MTEAEFLDVAREGIIVMIKISVPIMLPALLVGLVISLIQALTQIQEMTLAFVPKILVIFVSILFLMPFMLHTLTGFTKELMERIAGAG